MQRTCLRVQLRHRRCHRTGKYLWPRFVGNSTPSTPLAKAACKFDRLVYGDDFAGDARRSARQYDASSDAAILVHSRVSLAATVRASRPAPIEKSRESAGESRRTCAPAAMIRHQICRHAHVFALRPSPSARQGWLGLGCPQTSILWLPPLHWTGTGERLLFACGTRSTSEHARLTDVILWHGTSRRSTPTDPSSTDDSPSPRFFEQ